MVYDDDDAGRQLCIHQRSQPSDPSKRGDSAEQSHEGTCDDGSAMMRFTYRYSGHIM